MSLAGPGGIAQHHVCQMINIVQCFEIKFFKRRQKVLFCFVLFSTEQNFSVPWEGCVISGRENYVLTQKTET